MKKKYEVVLNYEVELTVEVEGTDEADAASEARIMAEEHHLEKALRDGCDDWHRIMVWRALG